MIFEPPYRQTIHYSQIPDLPASSPLYRELAAYRRVMPELLAAGLEGRWILMKDEVVVGDYATFVEAADAGLARFGRVPYLVNRIHEYEPLFRTPFSYAA